MNIKNIFTDAALNELKLIKENDYKLEGHYFRLKIDNKGCDGFEYQIGFSLPLENDKFIKFENKIFPNFTYIMDEFTAFYCQDGIFDFQNNWQENIEGFVYKNNNEATYKGKFYKDESLLPKEI